ncbi:MAG: NarK/NasA family nitrate transporter [Sulfurovum sp.]|nr:MAG: NarK/NasA family nitrate transporter [Sulfurovum sp.]
MKMKNTNIEQWDVEDNAFWESKGKKIANRNLWISIPALLLAFSVWLMWGMLIVQMKKMGFTLGMNPQTPEEWANVNSLLWTLPAVAGLAGATLRIPNGFLIGIGGGRNVIFLTTALLLIPAFGAGWAMGNRDVSYITLAVLAATSGFGGGNFSSSMSNISYFFPKRLQGTALGLNAGLGNLGVSVMQFLIPMVLVSGVFSAGMQMPNTDKLVYIQDAAWVWVPLIMITTIAVFFGMNNLKIATPDLGHPAQEFGKTILLLIFGVVAAGIGSYMLITLKINMWIVLPVVVIITLLLMKFLSPGDLKDNLDNQFAIFSNKHTLVMTIIYTMTFGSFIGFAASFPKLIQDIFAGEINAFTYAFLGPLVGALIRPVGGILADKIGSGSRVTAWSTILQIVAGLAVAYYIVEARELAATAGPKAAADAYWWPFFFGFMALFAGSGIGNGSTFRSVPYIFGKIQAGPVLGWTAAIAAYGAFIIPKLFGQQIKAGHAEYAIYGLVAYYVLCLILNWWYYDRKNAEVKC